MNIQIKYFVVVLILNVSCLFGGSLATQPLDHPLITLHGFMSGSWTMRYLSGPLKKQGYDVIHFGYPSRNKTIQKHGADLALALKEQALKNKGVPIDFLTHSMGALVLRAALNHPECPMEAKIGKAVLLTPPNGGASLARKLGKYAWVNLITKKFSGKELASHENFKYLGEFPPTLKVLVIAGNLSLNPFLEKQNDGMVTVNETYLETKHNHVILNVDHLSVLFSEEVSNLINEFFILP